MKHNFIKGFAVLLVLVTASLACNLPANDAVQTPVSVPSISEQDLQSTLEASVTVAPEQSTVTVVLTEQDLTAYIRQSLSTEAGVPLQNAAISLQNGKLTLTGQYAQDFLTADVVVVMVPFVTSNGEVQVTVESADFGPIPVPDSMKDSMTAAINEQLSKSLAPATTGVLVQNVVIASGTMTISGTAIQ